MLITPHRKNVIVLQNVHIKLRPWTDTLVRPNQRKRDMRFGTWNVKWDVGVWTGSSWLKIGTGGGHW